MIHDGDLVYHGSYMPVEKPLVERCRNGKDFGRGFYVTTSEDQAKAFTSSSVKKAITEGKVSALHDHGVVSVYRYHENPDINVFCFPDADREWLHCVVAHRKNAYPDILEKWKDYMIIIGKIANDTTNLVITTYMDGLYGDVFTERADTVAINYLEPENLRDQICFRSQDSISCLEYVDSYEVSIK